MRRGLWCVTVAVLAVGCTEDLASDPGTETAELASSSSRVKDVVTQVNLVADEEGKAARTDPNLVNAWGLAFGPGTPAWVSSAEKGLSQVYDATGMLRLSVTIPPPEGGEAPSAPTGQVFNAGDGFKGDRFIFATEDGTIAGWDGSNATLAAIRVDNSGCGANYKGITIARVHGHTWLYAADFRNNRIDVFDEDYQPVNLPWGRFRDPHLPSDYAPFNVLGRGNLVFVTYAKQDAEGGDDVKGPGHGFLDVFDSTGDDRLRLISRRALNSPWGMAFGPMGDDFSVRLFVGNFGDGRINMYRLSLERFKLSIRTEGPLGDAPDHPISIDGLWAIVFGNGVNGFGADELFFTAGPEDEEHGLFGKLVFTPPKE